MPSFCHDVHSLYMAGRLTWAEAVQELIEVARLTPNEARAWLGDRMLCCVD